MGLRRRELRLGSVVGRMTMGPTPHGDLHTILTVTNSGISDGGGGTLPLFTTAAPHGLVGAELLTVTGTSLLAYEGSGLPVTGTPSATTWVTSDLSYTANATGGTWALT